MPSPIGCIGWERENAREFCREFCWFISKTFPPWMRLSRRLVVLAANERLDFVHYYRARNLDADNVPVAGHVEHDVEHQLLQQAAEGASAGALFVGLRREFFEGVGGKLQLHS